MTKNNVEDVVLIKIEDLVKATWNAQEESPETFSNLVDEIETEGFDEPLIVIKHPKEEDKYLIVAGNHRYDAARLNGYEQLPCIVKDWDEDTAKIKSVQRNQLHGQVDQHKLRELVSSIRATKKISDEELSRSMAFDNMKEFYENVQKVESEKREKEAKEAYSHEDISKELTMVDNLSIVLNEIFSQYEGDTIDRGFMFFMHKKKLHLMVTCDEELSKTLEKTVDHINDNDKDASEFFTEVLNKEIKDA